MKVFNAFATLFATLAFLTLGSLLLMVALHLLSVQDAISRIQEIYSSPWRSLQTAMVGLLFIFVGLAFAKMLIKRSRQSEALIFHGETGPILVSVSAIEDMIKKALRRFSLVKEWKAKTIIEDRNVEIKLRLVLWSGGDLPAFLNTVQQELRDRLMKILGRECQLEISCDVTRIEESHLGMEEDTLTV